MDITISSIVMLVVFIIPGYFFNWARRRIAIRTDPTEIEFFIQSLCASSFVFALTFAIAELIGRRSVLTGQIAAVLSMDSSVPWNEIINLTRTFLLIIPACMFLGFLLGIIQRRLWIEGCLGLFRIKYLTPFHTEWDRLFASDPTWVQVRTKDGRKIVGVYRGASTYPSPQELLLERVIFYDSNNVAEEIENYTHLWIAKDEIQEICAMAPNLRTPSKKKKSAAPTSKQT